MAEKVSDTQHTMLIRYTKLSIVGNRGKVYTTSIPADIKMLFGITDDDLVAWYFNSNTEKIELGFVPLTSDNPRKPTKSGLKLAIDILAQASKVPLQQERFSAALKGLEKKKQTKK